MVCPLCHKAHEDPPDIAGGRVRVCEECHSPAAGSKPSKRTPKRRPPKKPPGGPPPLKE